MTILISGGTGFVGLNVAELLLARGEHVVLMGLDAPHPVAMRRFAALPGRCDAEICDVTDEAAFAGLLRKHSVDRLFALAAITAGPARESAVPERIIAVNVAGVIAQLRAARDAGVHRVVVPSSASVYGESFYGADPVVEDATPCRPISLYGISKFAAERSALRLGALWNLDVRSARLGGVFGPWEHDTGLRDMLTVHWQLARCARRGECAILPPAIPSYSWIYSRDAAAGLVHLLDREGLSGQVFNVCSGIDWGAAVLDWCARLRELFPRFTFRQSADPAEVTVRLVDSRSRTQMNIARIEASGWSPRFKPAAAYADYAAWITQHPDALDD